ncbi:E1-E2 ATPase-associated domain protein [Rivularia sp. IAM M-261]|nr:E1-E2 ATPase-associated domain protein [Rivularia sp. IAM M-261]
MYEVVHSTLGRYRIRVPRLADDLEFAEAVSNLLESLQFVKEVRINSAASSVVVDCKASAAKDSTSHSKIQEVILSCIEQANYTKQANHSDSKQTATDSFDDLDQIPEVNQWKDLGMPLLSFTLAMMAAPLEVPPLIVGTAIAGAALPWFNRAADSLINHRHPNIDLLDSVWMTMQTLQGQYIAPALKTSLVEIRRSFRGQTEKSREQKAWDLLDCLNQDVLLERDNVELSLKASELEVGDCIKVRTGDFIPVDGVIISGAGLIDCYHLTRKATPVHCGAGKEVYASSILLEGELFIEVKRTLDNTRIGLVASIMQNEPVYDTQIGLHQAEFVKNAILPTLLLGGTIFAATGNLGAAISPFQFDFGSGIPISISTTLLTALTYATENGVYIRSGRVLEVLSQIDTLVIDDSVLMYLDAIGSDVTKVINALQQQGISIYIVSYNLNQQIALDPDYVLREANPQKHLNLVRGLQHQGRTVAVLQDKYNYIPEFKIGDVSISIARNESVAEETADVVLLDSQLWGLIYGIAIAKKAMQVVYENTATIVVPNLMMQIGGGMVLGVNPVWNVIVNNSSAFIAEFINSARTDFASIPAPASLSRYKQQRKPSVLKIAPGSEELALPVTIGSERWRHAT